MKGYLLLVLLVATGVAAQTDKTPDKKTEAEPCRRCRKEARKDGSSEGTEGSAGKNETSSGRNRRKGRGEKATGTG